MAVAPLIFSAVTSLASAAAKGAEASLQRGEAELAAEGEELRVKQREADRKDRLAGALATQNAMAGAKGIAAFEGSPLTVLQDSIEREQLATERDVFSTELSKRAIRQTARSRARQKRISAAGSLFTTAQGIASTGGFGG